MARTHATLWIVFLMSLASAAAYGGAGGGAPPATAPARDNSAFILTPPARATPRINGPSIFGVRANHPVLYRIPATGTRPLVFSATSLPAGVILDAATGQLSGSVAKEGTYKIVLHAANSAGMADRALRIVVGDTIALTPPMGWNSYNVWSDQITQDRAIAAAKAMVSTGLIDHGWTYINMDDGWQNARGGEFNALQPDPRKFTDIEAMVDQIHQLGLKAGLYSSPWVMTYAGRLGSSAENPQGTAQRWPPGAAKNKKQLPFAIGTYKFMTNDARQFAAWGFDYLKYDWGPVEYPETKEMYDALHDQNRDIVFSISNNHVQNMFADIAHVSTVANAWRTTTDITDNWGRVSTDIGFNQDKWAPFARPGHYNDADMLVVGVVGWGTGKQHPSKLTVDEQFTHISLWAMLSSPMLLGCDMTQMDPFTLSLLTNDEVLAIDQDALVKQAVNVSRQGQLEVYRKELEDGSLAVGLFNRGPATASVTAQWSDLKVAGKQTVRDLWRQKDLGVYDQSFKADVASHGVVLVRVIPAK
jgi:alpha-galactosidase